MPLIGLLPPPIANIRYWPGPIPNIRYSSAFAIGAVQLRQNAPWELFSTPLNERRTRLKSFSVLPLLDRPPQWKGCNFFKGSFQI